MTYLDQATALLEETIANRRQIHRNPELGFDPSQTVAFVKEKLTEYGLEPQNIGQNGGDRPDWQTWRQDCPPAGRHGRSAHQGRIGAVLCFNQ